MPITFVDAIARPWPTLFKQVIFHSLNCWKEKRAINEYEKIYTVPVHLYLEDMKGKKSFLHRYILNHYSLPSNLYCVPLTFLFLSFSFSFSSSKMMSTRGFFQPLRIKMQLRRCRITHKVNLRRRRPPIHARFT